MKSQKNTKLLIGEIKRSPPKHAILKIFSGLCALLCIFAFYAKDNMHTIMSEFNIKFFSLGNTLHYTGDIDIGDFDELVKISERSSINMLSISSPGGNVGEAIRIGNYINDNGISVRVSRLCLSSCANYIFPAGKIKYLNEKSLLGWHGGLSSARIYDEDKNKDVPTLELIKTDREFMTDYLAELSLFHKIGINKKLVSCGSDKKLGGKGGMSSYSIHDLMQFGLHSIILEEIDTKQWVKNQQNAGILVIPYC